MINRERPVGIDRAERRRRHARSAIGPYPVDPRRVGDIIGSADRRRSGVDDVRAVGGPVVTRAVSEIVLPRRAQTHQQFARLIGKAQDAGARMGVEATPAGQRHVTFAVPSPQADVNFAGFQGAHEAPDDQPVERCPGHRVHH